MVHIESNAELHTHKKVCNTIVRHAYDLKRYEFAINIYEICLNSTE